MDTSSTTPAPPSSPFPDDAPGRVAIFLQAVASNAEIRALLLSSGYTGEEHSRGWRLLLDAAGYVPATLAEVPARALAALAELAAWEEAALPAVRSALKRLHPEQARLVLDGLDGLGDAPARRVIAALLERLDLLEGSEERLPHREADHAALDTLARRGVDRRVREHLTDLVAHARAAEQTPSDLAAAMELERRRVFDQLRAWYDDWAETARGVVRNARHRKLLGLEP